MTRSRVRLDLDAAATDAAVRVLLGRGEPLFEGGEMLAAYFAEMGVVGNVLRQRGKCAEVRWAPDRYTRLNLQRTGEYFAGLRVQ